VINFHPPGDHESYIHRVGRTGRAGRAGVGITLVGSEERREMSQLAHRLGLGQEGETDNAGAQPKPGPTGQRRRRSANSARRRRAAA
jgi:superfamily II DNA/RNA helicase